MLSLTSKEFTSISSPWKLSLSMGVSHLPHLTPPTAPCVIPAQALPPTAPAIPVLCWPISRWVIPPQTCPSPHYLQWVLNSAPCLSSLPLISNSAQCDFFPLAASSEDIIVYILRGSGGSYFSLGIPVENKRQVMNGGITYWEFFRR